MTKEEFWGKWHGMLTEGTKKSMMQDLDSIVNEPKNPNTNCLADMKCPNCGSYDPFEIIAEAVFVISDDGTDSYSEVEWDDNSHVTCPKCKANGVAALFNEKFECNCMCLKTTLSKGIQNRLNCGCLCHEELVLD